MSKLTTDRYTVGFIAGTIAGFMADLTSLVMTHLFKFGKVGYEDFAAVLVFGARADTIGEVIFAHWCNCSFQRF